MVYKNSLLHDQSMIRTKMADSLNENVIPLSDSGSCLYSLTHTVIFLRVAHMLYSPEAAMTKESTGGFYRNAGRNLLNVRK